jgi:hypothetical protein
MTIKFHQPPDRRQPIRLKRQWSWLQNGKSVVDQAWTQPAMAIGKKRVDVLISRQITLILSVFPESKS